MQPYLSYVLIALLVAILAVLLYGVVTMGRGGPGAGARSNKLMRWRIGLQFAALALIVLFFLLR